MSTHTVDAAAEQKVLEQVPRGLYIAGEWREASGGATLAVEDPSTQQTLVEVADATPEDALAALGAAADAQPSWAASAPRERGEILRRAYEALVERTEELALLMTLEMGKALAESRAEIVYAAEFLRWFSEEAVRVHGRYMVNTTGTGRILVLRQPVGPCVFVTPWNFPTAMGTRKIAPAIAAGCTMIVKPAQQTPLTALALAELGARAGIPAGVLNVVLGKSRDIGPELTGSPVVRKLTFTGSTEVGRTLIEQSAATIKKVSMELGGNAPVIVFDDADLETALTGVLAAKYRNTGESCIGANRIYVQAGIYDRFAKEFAERAAKLPVGDGFSDGVALGPLIDQAAIEKVTEHVNDAIAHGAEVLTGGAPHEQGPLFYQPTVLAEVTQAMLVAREETFGPVTPLIRFTDEADVLRWANDTEFGLAAYLFGRDTERIWKTAAALEAGMVGINTGLISNEVAPFGGIKQSGIGREGSVYGIEEYLEIKYLAWEGAGE